jgi:hypothetical protein
MEYFQTTQLAVPLNQIALLLTFGTLALLFGRLRLALLINYVFTLYWGYVFNRDLLFGVKLEGLDYFSAAYFGFGVIVVTLALIGFVAHRA